MVFLLGKKKDQTQDFTSEGERIPVTIIKTSPCYLINIKTPSKDGYYALTLGFDIAKKIKKPVQGQLAKAGIKTPLRFLKEFRLDKYLSFFQTIEENGKKGVKIGEKKFFIGDEIKANLVFNVGDLVDVSGKSKGKGFQGVVKRHGFAGGPRTHGQSDRERAPGSVGQTTTPGRIYKGKRMAGRMGGERITIKNLTIVRVEEDEIAIKGLIPGAIGGLVEIKKALKSIKKN